MTCRELSELVTEYLEGRMSYWDQARFQLHLGICPPCREYLRQMQTTVGALSRLRGEPMPDEVQRELLARFRDWKRDQGT